MVLLRKSSLLFMLSSASAFVPQLSHSFVQMRHMGTLPRLMTTRRRAPLFPLKAQANPFAGTLEGLSNLFQVSSMPLTFAFFLWTNVTLFVTAPLQTPKAPFSTPQFGGPEAVDALVIGSGVSGSTLAFNLHKCGAFLVNCLM